MDTDIVAVRAESGEVKSEIVPIIFGGECQMIVPTIVRWAEQGAPSFSSFNT